MVARVVPVSGAKVYIGGVAATTVDTITEFAALTYVEIAGISDIGNFGDTREVIEYNVIGEERTRKAGGTRNAGDMTLRMAFDAADAGQEDIVDAFEAAGDNAYGFKVEWDDKLTGSGTNTIAYFRGKVTANEVQMGGANNIVERNVTVAIDSPLYFVAAT